MLRKVYYLMLLEFNIIMLLTTQGQTVEDH